MKILEDVNFNYIAELLSNNQVIYIFNGRSESGPRALGNRSMIFNPTIEENKLQINRIKGRECFRPLACSILEDKANDWFCMNNIIDSPHMTYSFKIKKEKKHIVPAIVHVDETCRIQTVSKSQNINYYEIIESFFNLTKIPLVGNTSFNLAGDAMVETVDDAIKTLSKSEVNFLYFPEPKILVRK